MQAKNLIDCIDANRIQAGCASKGYWYTIEQIKEHQLSVLNMRITWLMINRPSVVKYIDNALESTLKTKRFKDVNCNLLKEDDIKRSHYLSCIELLMDKELQKKGLDGQAKDYMDIYDESFSEKIAIKQQLFNFSKGNDNVSVLIL